MDDQNNQQIDKKAVMDQAALITFVDDLINEKNNPPVSAEEKPSVREFLLEEVNNAINEHMVSLLADEDQIALENLLNSNPTDQQLNDFFTQKIPNLEIEIAAALLNFRAAYLTPVPEGNTDDHKPGKPTPPPPPMPAPIARPR